MSSKTRVTFDKGGSKLYTKQICRIKIPDLLLIVNALQTNNPILDGPAAADLILECWGIAHALKNHIHQSKGD